MGAIGCCGGRSTKKGHSRLDDGTDAMAGYQHSKRHHRLNKEIRAHTCEVKTDERPFISGDVRGSIREGVSWTRGSSGLETSAGVVLELLMFGWLLGSGTGKRKKTESLGRERFLSMRFLPKRSLVTSSMCSPTPGADDRCEGHIDWGSRIFRFSMQQHSYHFLWWWIVESVERCRTMTAVLLLR